MANTGRTNLLEEVGRIDAEKSNPNRRAEKRRVVGELNKGYKKGGRVGFKHGKYVRAAVPHADIDKLIDKGTGKEDDRKGNRYRVEGSELKFKKPRRSQGPAAGRPKGGWTS